MGFGSTESACCSVAMNDPTSFAAWMYTTGGNGPVASTALGIALQVIACARAGAPKTDTNVAIATAKVSIDLFMLPSVVSRYETTATRFNPRRPDLRVAMAAKR